MGRKQRGGRTSGVSKEALTEQIISILSKSSEQGFNYKQIAKRLNIKVCHIEAGLHSGDMTMPEEMNRLVTDRISDLLLNFLG